MAKLLTGTVASDKVDKTIVVKVQTPMSHPIYRKKYKISKKFLVHDEKNEAKVGDLVTITESKPISARKRFVLHKIIEKAAISQEDKELDV